MSTGSALVAVHAAVALFAFAALFGKWIALPATAIVLGRTAFAALALVLALRIRGRPAGTPTFALAGNGAILALHWVSFFAAVQSASVAVALLGYASFPLFVLLLERHPAPRARTVERYATGALVIAGLLVIVPAFSWSDRASQGLAWGIVSGFTFAWLALRNRSLVAGDEPARIALWQNAVAAGCLLPIAASEAGRSWPSTQDFALLAVLGVGCTALAHTLFIASMRRISAHAASVVAALEPVYGIALAAWLLGEVPGPRTLAGAALIVAAALIASRRV
ncbi:MAG TPA: DMT family transporter [Casimicrobiaceae bacterium]|nr:DMT family transporter [Casimicrobiaceae bacterium]